MPIGVVKRMKVVLKTGSSYLQIGKFSPRGIVYEAFLKKNKFGESHAAHQGRYKHQDSHKAPDVLSSTAQFEVRECFSMVSRSDCSTAAANGKLHREHGLSLSHSVLSWPALMKILLIVAMICLGWAIHGEINMICCRIYIRCTKNAFIFRAILLEWLKRCLKCSQV